MERTKRFILASVSKRRLLSFLALLLSTIMYAQSEISGTVIDATGETVIGAMVKEKGTSNGTVTDFDGNFKIKVNEGAILVISYIGYQTLEVPAQHGMKVTMKDDAEVLQEGSGSDWLYHPAQGRPDGCHLDGERRRNGQAEREQSNEGAARSRAGYEHPS